MAGVAAMLVLAGQLPPKLAPAHPSHGLRELFDLVRVERIGTFSDLLSALRLGSFLEARAPENRPTDPGLSVTSLGMSETGGPHTFWTEADDVGGSPADYRGAFGHEVPGTEHRIVDPDTGKIGRAHV